LIGAENYGPGFGSLPAVRSDIERMGKSLRAVGYEVEVCPGPVVGKATDLDLRIREFAGSGGADDVRLIYFSGHGLRVDDKDCIIPAGTSRDLAAVSDSQRVSTDLSATVAASDVGLVLFIIDACRDRADLPASKGFGAWGDARGLARPGMARFIRYFGCAADQVCQVIDSPGPSSLFTHALAACLDEQACLSLDDLLKQVETRCGTLLDVRPGFSPQTPQLSCGEVTSATHKLLARPIFDPVGEAALSALWPAFDPDKMHCLVVLSEYQAGRPYEWGLAQLVANALSGNAGDRVWSAFRSARDGETLVDGRRRALPEAFDASTLAIASFSVLDAFAGGDSLEKAVRALAQADLVAFDVTGFEPGVMLLAGIRSACRRGLNVCSHGNGWQEGAPLAIPFNMQDLNVNSHTQRKSNVGGKDEVVERFVQRVETGFSQLRRQPGYLDLPGYDAVRQLGRDYASSPTIGLEEQILLLCSYDKQARDNWQFVTEQLGQALWRRKLKWKRIERIIDYGTPQLVLQALYEQIRRTAACVVDWSDYSPSVFLELGTRLAVSEWGAIQVIDERYRPDSEAAKDLTRDQVEHLKNRHKLEQSRRMLRLFEPVVYRRGSSSAASFDRVVEVMSCRNPTFDGAAKPDYNRVYRALVQVIAEVQPALAPVVQELKQQADSLHHRSQGKKSVPQVLYSGSEKIKLDAERTATELRVAAWLYLEYRVGAARRKDDPEADALYRELGGAAIDALYDLGDDESMELAAQIEIGLGQGD